MKQIGVKSMKHIVGAGVLLMMALIIHPLFAGSRQAHLWCVPGFDVGTEERRVEDGNFSVKLVSSWDRTPRTIDFMRGQGRIGPIVKHDVFRFMGTGKTQWLSVEHMALAEDAEPSKNIATWVEAQMMLKGKVELYAPDGITYEQKAIARVSATDSAFMEKHQASQMSSHIGTVSIDGKWHRFFIVCLNRGKESWKIIKVFPVHPKKGASDKEASKIERSDLMTAGLFIGNFNILGKRMPKETPMRSASAVARSPIDGETLLRAVRAGNQEKVGELLSKGADPNFKGSRNMTPLGVFVSSSDMKKNLPILEMLLERGADPNKVWGDCGTTPFYYLVQQGVYGEVAKILPVVRLMLEHGADPNRKQGLFGLTPFGYAVTRSRSPDMDLVRAIAEHGGIVTQEMVDKVKDEKVKIYLQNRLKANAAKGKNEKGKR